MDELVDMMVSDESPTKISDKIKEILFSKSAESIDAARPYVSSSLFGENESEFEDENEEDFSDEEE